MYDIGYIGYIILLLHRPRYIILDKIKQNKSFNGLSFLIYSVLEKGGGEKSLN